MIRALPAQPPTRIAFLGLSSVLQAREFLHEAAHNGARLDSPGLTKWKRAMTRPTGNATARSARHWIAHAVPRLVLLSSRVSVAAGNESTLRLVFISVFLVPTCRAGLRVVSHAGIVGMSLRMSSG